jgi:hypothetical protein
MLIGPRPKAFWGVVTLVRYEKVNSRWTETGADFADDRSLSEDAHKRS